MYTLNEEMRVLISLILFGIYLISFIDMLDIICGRIKKKVLQIIFMCTCWITQLYITFIFSYNIMNGYVPIYFILFIYIGAIIYIKLFKKYFKKIFNIIYNVLNKLFKYIIKLLKPLLYSKYLVKFIKREIRIIRSEIKNKK